MPKRARPKNVRDGGRSSTPASRVHPLLIPILLFGIVVCIFAQTVQYEFINYDDDQYVYGNPRITSGLSLENIGWAFTHVHADNWHPLTTISHMLDCQIFGLQPWGPHAINVLLHAAVAVLFYLALVELTGLSWPSALVAALFAIHPLRVESVAWVAERKDVLSGVFFMMTLWFYARYARCNRAWSSDYVIALISFAVGLLCKPTLVTLPFVLLLLDYWPLQRFSAESLRSESFLSRRAVVPGKSVASLVLEKLPFFLLSAGSCVATVLAQEKTMLINRELDFGVRVGNAMVSYVVYIGQMFWPVGLCPVYPYQVDGSFALRVIMAGIILLIVSVALFVWRRKYPYLLVGWLWFLGVLVPMIGVVQVGSQARADRYTYLSQIGLYLLLIWGGLELTSKGRGRGVLVAVAVVLIAMLSVGCFVQAGYWKNSETLWSHTLAQNSKNALAHSNLGNALMKKGRLEEADQHLRSAIEIQPKYPEPYNTLGYVLMKKGLPTDAVVQFQKALELNPGLKNAEYNLGFARGYALAQQGKTAEAIVAYQSALKIQPNDFMLRNNLAASLAEAGRTPEAIEQLREAVRLEPAYEEAHVNLATLLLQAGYREEAIMQFQEALRLKPDDAEVRARLRQMGVE